MLPITGTVRGKYALLTNAALTLLTHDTVDTLVHHFWITEYAGSGTTIFIYLDDGTNTYRILPNQTIGANLRVEWSTSFVIPRKWSLKADAGADSRLAMGITYSQGSPVT